MPVTYTNRKNVLYYLCVGLTKTGKPRYYFPRQPKDGSPEEIPAGYQISESVNGVVWLVKQRPQLILPEEVSSVESALHRHLKGREYRVDVKNKQIVVYEQLGPDMETLDDIFSRWGPNPPETLEKVKQEYINKWVRFGPVLRFILINPKERKFTVERRVYFDKDNDWIDLGELGDIEDLARRLIPKLETDEYFDLF